MILLRPDCLVFKTSDGESVPCSAHEVTLEVLGDSIKVIDPEIVEHAAQAVLHYFKTELGRTQVSIGEFTEALENALRGLGLEVVPQSAEGKSVHVVESDLCGLAVGPGVSFELEFFPRLREEVRRQVAKAPQILRFRGLRDCVLRLTGAKRWNNRCQALNDQIVDFLRTCLQAERSGNRCALVVL